MCIQDKSPESCDCGTAFTFSAEEQQLLVSAGDPSESERCLPCRRMGTLGLDLLKSFEHQF
ncbi:zinc-ribbon domain containing protein [Chloroflexota bacterium]